MILEVLSEFGILGVATVLLPVIAGGVCSLRSLGKVKPAGDPYLYLYVFALASAQFSGDIVDSRLVYFFSTLMLTRTDSTGRRGQNCDATPRAVQNDGGGLARTRPLVY